MEKANTDQRFNKNGNYVGQVKIDGRPIKFIKNGNAVIVTISVNHPVIVNDEIKHIPFTGKGVARCNPEDKFVLKFGVRMALAKAIASIHAQVKEQIRKDYLKFYELEYNRLCSELVFADKSMALRRIK